MDSYNYDVNKMISCTTSPPRDYEKKHGSKRLLLFLNRNAAFAEKEKF